MLWGVKSSSLAPCGQNNYALHFSLFKAFFWNYPHILKLHLNFLLDLVIEIAILINIY